LERAFVWSGGAMFVLSLAVCAWTYLVSWSGAVDPAISGARGWPLAAIAVDAALLTIFAAHHSVFARDRVKRAMTAFIPERLLRSTYVWIASLLLIAVCAAWQSAGGTVYRAGGAIAVAHAVIQIVGVVFIARAVARIDGLELAGIRPPGTTSAGLQIVGPYRLVRHPLYLGWVLAVFGAAHMTADRLLFAILTSFYLVIAVPWEERALLKSFGEEYARYQRQVRWRILPYLY
jgi:methanethiol S-methyltransferase